MPPQLSEIRLVDAGGANVIVHDLRLALRDAGVGVTEGAALVLRLRGESFSKQVLSVDSSGRATEYTLRYKVSFGLMTAGDIAWIPDEQITSQRDLRFDASAVLATSGEETQLQGEMRRDAVAQIMRRLQYVKAPTVNAQ